LAPDSAGHLDTLAMLVAQNNDYSQGLVSQRKALGLQPADRSVPAELGAHPVLAGPQDEARRELKMLAELGDKFGAQSEAWSSLTPNARTLTELTRF
jgi:Flp pilus assembly protein TadD